MGAGQISGIVFIILLYVLRASNGSMALPLTLLNVLMVGALISLRVKESKLILQDKSGENQGCVKVAAAAENG